MPDTAEAGRLWPQGFQRNPGVKTVEEDYHKAIHAAGGISDDNLNDFTKVPKP